MFTGIIEQKGTVLRHIKGSNGHRLEIRASLFEPQSGESIAINGVCLTLLPESKPDMLMFDVSPETLSVTTLGALVEDSIVNIERAMSAQARFGGHYVSGHVDATAKILGKRDVDGYVEMIVGDFSIPASMFLLSKGSIALDGVSLTINHVNDDTITLLLIPHTLSNTSLAGHRVGDRLNVEFDYLTRIIAHQLKVVQK